MNVLNRPGEKVQTIVRVASSKGRTLFCKFYFFNGSEFVASSDRLGSARLVAPGTVAVSVSGRQWVATGGDRINGAAGWSFVSRYVNYPPVRFDVVRFNDNAKSLKLRSKLDQYLDYFLSVKGFFPDSVILRREQLSIIGAMPGQFYKGIRLGVYA